MIGVDSHSAGRWRLRSVVAQAMACALVSVTVAPAAAALAFRGVGEPSLAAATLKTGGFDAVSELRRADDAFQSQNVGRDRQIGLFGRDRVVATGVHTSPR